MNPSRKRTRCTYVNRKELQCPSNCWGEYTDTPNGIEFAPGAVCYLHSRARTLVQTVANVKSEEKIQRNKIYFEYTDLNDKVHIVKRAAYYRALTEGRVKTNPVVLA